MNRKMLTVIALGLFVAAFNASAKPGIRAAFKATYPNAKVSDCLVCHANEDDYERNPYGQAVEDSGLNFKAIENLDSDGDGVSNLAEILAGTYPGDASSL